MTDPVLGTLAHIDGAGGTLSKWCGICAGPDGKLYCAPFRASTVRHGSVGSVSETAGVWVIFSRDAALEARFLL